MSKCTQKGKNYKTTKESNKPMKFSITALNNYKSANNNNNDSNKYNLSKSDINNSRENSKGKLYINNRGAKDKNTIGSNSTIPTLDYVIYIY